MRILFLLATLLSLSLDASFDDQCRSQIARLIDYFESTHSTEFKNASFAFFSDFNPDKNVITLRTRHRRSPVSYLEVLKHELVHLSTFTDLLKNVENDFNVHFFGEEGPSTFFKKEKIKDQMRRLIKTDPILKNLGFSSRLKIPLVYGKYFSADEVYAYKISSETYRAAAEQEKDPVKKRQYLNESKDLAAIAYLFNKTILSIMPKYNEALGLSRSLDIRASQPEFIEVNEYDGVRKNGYYTTTFSVQGVSSGEAMSVSIDFSQKPEMPMLYFFEKLKNLRRRLIVEEHEIKKLL